jgi:uncharacterized protein with GYD domain
MGIGGGDIPHYIILGNWTEQGIRNVKDAPRRIKNTGAMIKKAGGKMQLYYTFGKYDFVMVVEIPSDENMLKTLLWLGRLGNVRTITLKAWTESDGAKIISQLK